MIDMNAIWQTYLNCAGLVITGVALLIILFCGAATLCAACACKGEKETTDPARAEAEAQAASALPNYFFPPIY